MELGCSFHPDHYDLLRSSADCVCVCVFVEPSQTQATPQNNVLTLFIHSLSLSLCVYVCLSLCLSLFPVLVEGKCLRNLPVADTHTHTAGLHVAGVYRDSITLSQI